ncbi:nucleotidyltransferase family protein [Allomesorhizobium alhagi]|jgi:hypothetical protein|uniref:Nucleotidyltransferase family protein n=1 Tax=Mesorhizobium alhagi CCNWXJ12-2 TaxID=1107882 RepID=H0HM18_9HYPH|nr:nucleotidyltransferase family protein [Mesorhizobium alhagi]EHK58210.1 hypothetical protein MAXJ12_05908 [Mesorhizobium alhagi CCNWXJ12-2]
MAARQGSGSIPETNASIDAKAAPTHEHPEAEAFYATAIGELAASGLPFLIAGAYAVSAYTGISRETKDLDIFCKAGDSTRILALFKDKGYAVEVEDDRWLGKVFQGRNFFDVIFSSSNGAVPVGDSWFEHACAIELFGIPVRIIGPTELVWSKSFIQTRHRYDGADVAHLLLRAHDQIDWQRLLVYMEAHWEVLLVHLLNFRWIYPSERAHVPEWLLDELLDRLAKQRELPPSHMKICRGRMYSLADYDFDVGEWGFADVGGDGERRND